MKTTTATPQNITAAAVVRALAQSLTLAAFLDIGANGVIYALAVGV